MVWVWVALLGGVGALGRHASVVFLGVWPGTFLVNSVGALLFGLVYSSVQNATLKAALLSGLLGALTTFSTFIAIVALESRRGSWSRALIYLAVSIFVGWLAFESGVRMGRLIARS